MRVPSSGTQEEASAAASKRAAQPQGLSSYLPSSTALLGCVTSVSCGVTTVSMRVLVSLIGRVCSVAAVAHLRGLSRDRAPPPSPQRPRMAAPQAAARPGGAAPPRPRPGPPSEKPPPPFDVGLLLSLVSGLGSVKQLADGSAAYVADEQCLDCLYDIQRFLRRDEPATRDVVCQLSDWNALRQHFVPLLVTYASKFDVAFNATKVRVCVCVCLRRSPPACCVAKTSGSLLSLERGGSLKTLSRCAHPRAALTRAALHRCFHPTGVCLHDAAV